jgi:hypothetical protein
MVLYLIHLLHLNQVNTGDNLVAGKTQPHSGKGNSNTTKIKETSNKAIGVGISQVKQCTLFIFTPARIARVFIVGTNKIGFFI